MPFQRASLVIDLNVRNLCGHPYVGHPKGCPNYGQRLMCPPYAPLIGEELDLSETPWVVWNVFDLSAHVERLRTQHPDWSDRQLYCCLYWQGTARAALRGEVLRCRQEFSLSDQYLTVWCPEACGVNVTSTMLSLGMVLEWPVRTVAYQVAVIGRKNEDVI